MAREKPPEPDTSGEVPTWFMTYSDVITLLMTFFILLLTFATHEPENFERVKVSMFGSGGSPGLAGKKSDALDRESVSARVRPDVARMSPNGSETPPTEVDPVRDAMGEGLKTLESESDLAKFQRPTFEVSRNTILDTQGNLTTVGEEHLRAISGQIIQQDMQLSIAVGDHKDTPAAVQMAYRMWQELGVKLGSVSVETQINPDRNTLLFTLTRKENSVAQ